jgi:hypothetical protein
MHDLVFRADGNLRARESQDRASDHTIPDAYVNLMERAIQAGKSQDDFACLFEILSHSRKA